LAYVGASLSFVSWEAEPEAEAASPLPGSGSETVRAESETHRAALAHA